MGVKPEKREELILRFVPLAKKMASQYRTLPFEDCFQESILAIIHASNFYKKGRGHFAAYAKMAVRNRLNALYAIEKKTPLYLDTDSSTFLNIEDQNSKVGEEDVDSLELFSSVLKKLSSQEANLVELRIKGKNQVECSEDLGVSQATISRLLSKIRRKIEDAG